MNSKFLLIVISVGCFLFSCHQPEDIGYVIKNVNVIPIWKDTLLKSQDIKIVSGQITTIQENIEPNKADTIIEGNGGYILPGFWDMHTHLPNKVENGLGYEEYLALNILTGVTHIRNMRYFKPIDEVREKIKSKSILSPSIYYTPPPISRSDHIPIDSLGYYAQKYKADGFKYWKILSLPSKEYFDSLALQAKENELKLVGHISSLVGIEESILNEYKGIEHLHGYVNFLSDSVKFNDLLQLTREYDVFNCATLDWYYRALGQYTSEELFNQKSLKYIPKETLAEWEEDELAGLEKRQSLSMDSLESIQQAESNFIANKNKVLNKMFNSGCKLLMSPDANGKYQVPGFSMRDEMKIYEKAGIPLYHIYKIASLNAAEWMDEKDLGMIKVGAKADFVLYKNNPLEDLDHLQDIMGIYWNQQWLDQADIVRNLKKLER